MTNENGTLLDFSPEEVNKRLREQYTEIARLAGGLAHEVKNPLSTIRLNLDLLAEDLEDLPASPQTRRALMKIDAVKKESVRLEDLLNEFLDFTRAHHMELAAGDVNRELKEIVDFFRPRADAAHVQIIEFFTSDLPTIRIDRRSFHRAILNLLLNALQAMPDGGELLVRTRACGSNVAIDLIDTGCGMDHQTMQKIFEPFYSTKQGGSGLGLPTVRKIIEGHGGRMAIQSEPDAGTQFTLTFPSLVRLKSDTLPGESITFVDAQGHASAIVSNTNPPAAT
ncbi:MAG: ATP-binding protein [Planctomycetia bacterium]|nr:ATP-binding protein [Planctomycetia bacterium]